MLKRISFFIALISFIFCIAVGTLLIAEFYSFKQAQPDKTEALDTLKKELANSPDNELLRDQIRELDLLARQGYFRSRETMRTASLMLLAGTAVFLFSLHLACGKKGIDLPEPCKGADSFTISRPGMRAATAVVIAGLISIGFLAALSGKTFLEEIQPKTEQAKLPAPVQKNPEPAVSEKPISGQNYTNNWPFFRGPDSGRGPTLETLEWKQSWSVELPGPGFNSPIIWEDKIFLSTADEDEKLILCYSLDNGQQLWQTSVDTETVEEMPEVTEDTGYAASTLAVDGQRVYAIFADGDLAAVNFNGEIVWQDNLGVPENHYGHSSSLIAWENRLFIQYDHRIESLLFIYNAETGYLLKDIERDVEISWASPLLITDPEPLLILSASPKVVAYNPLTGEKYWENECIEGEVAPSPAYANNRIFVVNDSVPLVALDAQSGQKLWENDDLESPDVASPVAAGNFVYTASSGGLLTCFQSTTGEIIYEQEFENGFYASPLICGDKLLLIDKTGTIFISAKGPQFTKPKEHKLNAPVVSTPAVTTDCIIIRTWGKLIKVQ